MRIWTDQEISFLISNYSKTTLSDIAIKLNKTYSAVESKSYKLKLGHDCRWTKDKDMILQQMFSFGDKQEIINLTNKTWRGICHRSQKLGLSRPISSNYSNITYFDTWSEEMAYILGFIAADGCIQERVIREKYVSYLLSINLSRKDKLHLEKIRNILAPDKKIYDYLEYNKNGKIYEHSVLSIGSNYMCKQLMKLGIGPRKSLTLNFPKVSEEYLSHFIRGYFDGDGCISKRKDGAWTLDFVGTYDFLKTLSEIIDKKFEFKTRTISKKSNCEMYSIRYTTQQVINILTWLYDNETICLERKYNKYSELLNSRGKTQC